MITSKRDISILFLVGMLLSQRHTVCIFVDGACKDQDPFNEAPKAGGTTGYYSQHYLENRSVCKTEIEVMYANIPQENPQ